MNRWIYAYAALAGVSWGAGPCPVRAQSPATAAPDGGSRQKTNVYATQLLNRMYLSGNSQNAPHALGDMGRRIVSLETDHAEPMEAILNLMRSAGANYVIGGDVLSGRKITARFKDVTLAEALDALADAAGLQYHARGNIIVLTSTVDASVSSQRMDGIIVPWANRGMIGPSFGPNPNNPYYDYLPTPGSQPGGSNSSRGDGANLENSPLAPSSSGPDPKAERQTLVLPLKYASSVEMAGLIPVNTPPYSSLTVTPDTRSNALIATGTGNALRSLESLLTQLDVPGRTSPSDRSSRRVTIKLHLFERPGSLPQKWFSGSKAAGGTPELQALVRGGELMTLIKEVEAAGGILTSSPVVMTQDGTPAQIRIGSPEDELRAADQARGSGIVLVNSASETFTLLPRIESDDSITMTGSLTLENSLGSATAAASDDKGSAPTSRPSVPSLEASSSNRVSFVQRIRPWDTLAILAPAGPALKDGSTRKIFLLVSASAVNRTAHRFLGAESAPTAASANR